MSNTDTILLSTDTLEDIIRRLQKTQREIQSYRSSIQAVYSKLDRKSGSEVRVSGFSAPNCGAAVGAGSVKSVLSGCRGVISSCADRVGELSKAVSNACDLFEGTENSLVSRFQSMDIAAMLELNGRAHDGGGREFGAEKNLFEIFWDNVKTGATIVGETLVGIGMALKQDWDNKGLSYRIVKGAGAVIEIIAGSAAVVAAATGTGATAGLSAPVTVLFGVYGANMAASGFADLYNCITGNVDAIGEVNLLKSGLEGIGGTVGGWLGNAEAGQNVGEAAYVAGNLVTAVVSLSNVAGQIKQSATAASTLKQSSAIAKDMLSKASKEIPTAANGLGFILNCNLRDVPYQLSQLSKAVPNITKVISEVKLVEKGVSSTMKVINTGAECAEALTGWEMTQKPTIYETVTTVKDTVTAPTNLISDVLGHFETFRNGFAVGLR